MIILRQNNFSDQYHWRQPYDDLNGENVRNRDFVSKNGKYLENDSERQAAFNKITKDLRGKGNPKLTKGHSGFLWDRKTGTLTIKGVNFDKEAEDIAKARKEGRPNRGSASIFVTTGNKDGKEAYKNFLKYEKTLNPHYRISKETREAVKNEIRKTERNHKLKVVGASTIGAATVIGTGIAAKKIYDKKKKDKK